jgi:phospholipid/cholesterol/gamma-HCH transport system permease protein
MVKIFETIGNSVLKFFTEAGKISILFVKIFYWMFKKPSEWKNIIHQMVIVGVNSFVVITITSLSTGMVLALQTGSALERKISGSALFLGGIVSLSLVRELAPVLAGIIIAGRIGSAIAAEIGTMNVTEQIDALYTMATSPIKYLAVPRFLSCVIMLPVLTIYSNLIGILGGLFISMNIFGVSANTFIEGINFYLSVDDIFKGLFKTLFFGAIIATVGCYKGFETVGGAEGVGKSTTSSVVISSMLILVADYILTAFLW